MEESVRPEPAAARPPRGRARPTAAEAPGPPDLGDPRALTILTTEHWGLLTARSLVYGEAFSRGAMFLTFLSASLIALGFVAGGSARGPEVTLVAVAILMLDLSVGLMTLGRLVGAGREEIRALQGMARLRHAYLEMAPGVRGYLVNPWHDDLASVLSAYGSTETRLPGQNVLHGLTTMPGLVAAIDCALAGALVAVVAAAFGASPTVAVLLGIAAGVASTFVIAAIAGRVFMRAGSGLDVRFPAAARSGTGTTAGTGDQEPGRRNT